MCRIESIDWNVPRIFFTKLTVLQICFYSSKRKGKNKNKRNEIKEEKENLSITLTKASTSSLKFTFAEKMEHFIRQTRVTTAILMVVSYVRVDPSVTFDSVSLCQRNIFEFTPLYRTLFCPC